MGIKLSNLTETSGLTRPTGTRASGMKLALSSGKMKPSEVLEECIENIGLYEERLGAWAFINIDSAREVARELDNKKPSGALFGIPFAIKDNIDTFDMLTAYGTDIYLGYQPGRDAACVAGMRSSNGVALGKTICTEFAHRHPTKQLTHGILSTPQEGPLADRLQQLRVEWFQ